MGGPAWESAPDRGYSAITGATFAVRSPSEVAARWAALFGTECTGDDIELEGATLRFVSIDDGRSGLCEVTIAGGHATTATIAGVRFTVTPRRRGGGVQRHAKACRRCERHHPT